MTNPMRVDINWIELYANPICMSEEGYTTVRKIVNKYQKEPDEDLENSISEETLKDDKLPVNIQFEINEMIELYKNHLENKWWEDYVLPKGGVA